MRTLQIRIFSAAIGLLMLAGLAYAGPQGLRLLCLIAVILGVRETARILFPPQITAFLRWSFAGLTVALFVIGVYLFDWLPVVYSLAFIVFFSMTLFKQNSFSSLDLLVQFQAKSLVGFFYLALLPTMVARLLVLDHGFIWFLALLGFVFAGDTCAYLVGSQFGKHPFFPGLSPKKTLEGSAGGLMGSALAACVFHLFLPQYSLAGLVFLSLVVGFAGQMGDFFESLLKRVANQKDSGSLMPGHGGVLDRIDGVLFAGPLMYFGASLFEKWF